MENPKIRFKGFTKDWEQRKLADVVDSVDTGKSKFDKEGSSGEYPILGSTSVIGYDDEYDYEGDFILTARVGANAGSLYRHTGKVKISDNTVFIQASQNIEFFYQLLIQFDIKKLSFGTGQPLVKASELKSLELMMPTDMKEQMQIGEYFKSLDHLITLHQRKCEQTKKLKKYMLQKMFPQNGAKVPEIRFDGFTYDWEQRKLIDVCDYVDYRGKTPTKTDSGVFLVTAKNVKDGYIDYGVSQEYISEDDYEEVMHRGKPEIGDVLITTEAPCGNVAQVNRADIALAQRIIKYRGQSNIVDNTYLKYYLLSPEFQNILNAKSSGGTVKGIKGSILHQQEIKYPKYEEQFKIGSYFNNLDHLITLHQRQHKLHLNMLL